MARFLMFALFVFTQTLFAGADASEQSALGEETRNWAEVGKLSRAAHLPVGILISSGDCAYCSLLKREVLLPGIQDGSLSHRILLREIDLHSGGKLVDFDGERVRSRIFISRYKVKFTPTLLILNDAGEVIAKPLIGYRDADDYQHALAQTLEAISSRGSALAQND